MAALPRHSGRRAVAGFRFRLFSRDDEELGEFQTATREWHVGDQFSTAGAGRGRFRILAIVPETKDSPYDGSFEVESVEKRLPGWLLVVGVVVVLAGLMGYLFSSVWWTIGVLAAIPVWMFLDWYASRPGDREIFPGKW